MAGLPIVKMTLYKHGVGFYQRRGTVEEGATTLLFRVEEMNDVLKSLTAYTVDGGQVLSVDYETPEDRAARLARSSIHLSDEAALRDLLRDLRGRTVEVQSAGRTVQGTVIGLDLPSEREPMGAALLSLLLPDGATVEPVRLGDVTSLRLTDAKAAGDLAFTLNASLADENKRAVTVRLSPGARDLVISYIAPSPTWRVSYRLVVDQADGRPRGILQGWGLFDNTFDEDLQDVQITLVAGMPVSFVYDLYTPFTPQRPTVREEARTVAGPIEFEGVAEAPGDFLAAAAPGPMAAAARRARGPGAELMKRLSAAELADATAVAATGQAQGEFFSYAISHPVSVLRGRSAMVPILQQAVDYRKERIYSAAKHPVNPVLTARFVNNTGLTLERGPVTVIEDGEYAGEAILPFTGPGAEIYLAYAVDLGIKVTQTSSGERIVASVGIERGLLAVHEYDVQRIRYRIANNNVAAAEVTIEHPRLADYEPFETAAPAETTADAYRYVVKVKAHGSATFTAAQRRLVARHEEIRSQRLEQLRRWLRDHILDEEAFAALQQVLALYDQISEKETRLKENEARRQEIRGQQKTIQGNLAALKDQGEEGQLRARYVRTLNGQEDTLAALKASDAALREEIERIRAKIEAALKGF